MAQNENGWQFLYRKAKIYSNSYYNFINPQRIVLSYRLYAFQKLKNL